jgi:protein-S-isoprenylcysteine O-methyltransferase Ste14
MNPDIAFRGIFLFVFLSAFVISGYYRKRARQSGETIPRRAEGTTTLFLRMLMALIVAVAFFAYVFAPTWLAWSALDLPVWLRSAAAVIALATLPAIRWVFVNIGTNISETILTKRYHQLVTGGPYRWIRHPLYAFALLLLLSLALLASNWFLLLFPCIGLVVFRFIVIPREEANLIKVFGEQYEEYQRRTGALFPRFGPEKVKQPPA